MKSEIKRCILGFGVLRYAKVSQNPHETDYHITALKASMTPTIKESPFPHEETKEQANYCNSH
jgi:hypothetical protein